MTVQAVSDKLSRSQAVVLLRYTLIISVAYLLLVEHEFSSAPSGLILLIAVALMSNVVMAQLPGRDRPRGPGDDAHPLPTPPSP